MTQMEAIDPEGVVWRLERKWRWRPRWLRLRTEEPERDGSSVHSDADGLIVAVWAWLGTALVISVLIPLLVLGVEVVLFALVLLVPIWQPWSLSAVSSGGDSLRRNVWGRKRSQLMLDEIRTAIEHGSSADLYRLFHPAKRSAGSGQLDEVDR